MGGLHDGLLIEFCERTNALIGAPNVGKTLVVDGLKFVFGISTEIDEVENASKARMSACLEDGDSIVVRVRTKHGTEEIERTVGGATLPPVPMQPIVFSQTELVRRAHEAEPSIDLLDIHNPPAPILKQKLRDSEQTVDELFTKLWNTAGEARELADFVENPVDGLAATRKRLADLAGAEDVARRSNDIARIEDWRARMRLNVAEWESEFELAAPDVPSAPQFETDDSRIPTQVPIVAVEAALASYKVAADSARRTLRKSIEKALDETDSEFDSFKEETADLLEKEGFAAGSDALNEITDLRARALNLEKQAESLARLDQTLDQGIVKIAEEIKRLEGWRGALRNVRKSTCKRINKSMRSFAAKVTEDSEFERLDALIEDLKTGTQLRAEGRAKLKSTLNRTRLLERALRLRRNDLSKVPDKTEWENQDEVVTVACERAKLAGLVELACLWPGDGLDLMYLGETPPRSFTNLTEGLRALAIKEISFADSPLPVVSDQPEDAVPTRSVYENLVPTLRNQRCTRQFIVISHDANIVVAGDVDKVIVLKAGTPTTIGQGTLQDQEIREAALEHLEGGEAAFNVRSKRYSEN